MKANTVPTRHIGVDVSKATLDIYIPAEKEGLRPTMKKVENRIQGFQRLRELSRNQKAVVCVEPTGGYEIELIEYLHRFGVAVAYTDSRRVRQFAEAEGTLSKNDRTDAALIWRFAEKIGMKVLEEQDVAMLSLRRRNRCRNALIEERIALENRLETETDKSSIAAIERIVRDLNKSIERMEALCCEAIRRNPEKDALRERFVQVGGIGNLSALAILAELPEIGSLRDEELNRLVGISPEQRQSGTLSSANRIRGGRKELRKALYMATIACLKWNSKLRLYYDKKRAEGHPHKWAIVPTMRKLLSLLNRIARDPNFTPAPEPECSGKNRSRKMA